MCHIQPQFSLFSTNNLICFHSLTGSCTVSWVVLFQLDFSLARTLAGLPVGPPVWSTRYYGCLLFDQHSIRGTPLQVRYRILLGLASANGAAVFLLFQGSAFFLLYIQSTVISASVAKRTTPNCSPLQLVCLAVFDGISAISCYNLLQHDNSFQREISLSIEPPPVVN